MNTPASNQKKMLDTQLLKEKEAKLQVKLEGILTSLDPRGSHTSDTSWKQFQEFFCLDAS